MDIKEIKSIEDVAAFCKRKGFVFQGSEIYGGLAGFWDYGPLGTVLKNKIKQHWIKYFVQKRDDMVLIDGAIITREDVWKASGHVDSFKDAFSTCTKCKKVIRVDHLIEDQLKIPVEGLPIKELSNIIKKHKLVCTKCKGKLAEPKYFGLMFDVQVGPTNPTKAYLRPETCQTIFTNFKNVVNSSRVKLPFGITQIGKAFRNEIAPRDFLFRAREFEQLEIEYFVHPDKLSEFPYKIPNKSVNVLTAKEQIKKKPKLQKFKFKELFSKNLVKTKWHAYWIYQHYNWFLELGVSEKKLRFREHRPDELSHYSSATFDIEYEFPFGWKELGGNADRSQFDLSQHIKFSKEDLTYFDGEKKVVPAVVAEPSQGVSRAFLAVLLDAFKVDKDRIVLKFKQELAPIEVAVFPLVKKQHRELAREVYEMLREESLAFYDETGSIGKRYRRMDESGCPYCVTIDHDSIKKKDVTIRERDSMKQKRVKIKDLVEYLKD